MPFEQRENMYLRLPKVGEKYDFSQHGKIVEIKKIDNPEHRFSRFNFTQNKTETVTAQDGTQKDITTKEDLGYFYRIIFEDGKVLQISDWTSYYAMTKVEVVEGDSLNIKHPERGIWIVEKK